MRIAADEEDAANCGGGKGGSAPGILGEALGFFEGQGNQVAQLRRVLGLWLHGGGRVLSRWPTLATARLFRGGALGGSSAVRDRQRGQAGGGEQRRPPRPLAAREGPGAGWRAGEAG